MNNIQWESCHENSVTPSFPIFHSVYRGFEVHDWEVFYCAYPVEGEATRDEIQALLDRIERAKLGQYLAGSGYPTSHRQCTMRQRTSEVDNYCLLVRSMTDLDAIIDGLLAKTFPHALRQNQIGDDYDNYDHTMPQLRQHELPVSASD